MSDDQQPNNPTPDVLRAVHERSWLDEAERIDERIAEQERKDIELKVQKAKFAQKVRYLIGALKLLVLGVAITIIIRSPPIYSCNTNLRLYRIQVQNGVLPCICGKPRPSGRGCRASVKVKNISIS